MSKSVSFVGRKDTLKLSSFKKKTVQLLAEQCARDAHRLLKYLTKIIHVRFLLLRYELSLYLKRTKAIPGLVTIPGTIRHMYTIVVRLPAIQRTISADYFTVHFAWCALSGLAQMPVCLYGIYLFMYAFKLAVSIHVTRHKHGFVSLPTRTRKYTVIRSPHIYKVSREQFKLQVHKRLYAFPVVFSRYYLYLCDNHYSNHFCDIVFRGYKYVN
jgi:hypothetical protein